MDSLISTVPWLVPLAIAAAAVGLVAGLLKPIRAVWRFVRRISRFLDEWGGHTGTPGVMHRLDRLEERQHRSDERLAFVEGQLRPNGGSSFYDRVVRATEGGS